MIGTKTVGNTAATSYMVIDEEFEKVVIQTATTLFISDMCQSLDHAVRIAFDMVEEVRRQGEKRVEMMNEVERKRKRGY